MTKNNPATAVPSTEALARHLGISRWTVSRALNGHPGVGAKTVQRVNEAVERLGFRQNPHAMGLRGGRTGMIGLCFQELESPMLSRKAAALQGNLRQAGWHSLMELTNRDAALEEQVLRHFIAMRTDAIVIIGSILPANSSVVSDLAAAERPVLLVDPEIPKPFPTLAVDRAGALCELVDLCRQAGSRTFGLAGFDPDYTYSRDRLKGWQKARRNWPVKEAWTLFEPGVVCHDYAYGARLAGRLQREGLALPDTVLCVNDRVAIGFMDVLRRNGVRVPQDVGIVGHDNLEVAAFVHPSLTTVDQCIDKLMQRASDLLVQMLTPGGWPFRRKTEKVSTTCVLRESHVKK